MGKSLRFINSKKIFLLSGAALALIIANPVYAQEDGAPSPEMMMKQENPQPENILGDAPSAEQSAEVVTSGQPPSQEELDDLDRQLENIQNIIDEANADVSDNSLPDIDPLSEPDVYYDSTPGRRGVQPTAPEKVDPAARPAGKVIYVQKDFDAGHDKSVLVAAKRALSLGRYDSALDLYNQLYQKNPRDARVLMGRAIALQNLGRVQTAIESYEELLDVDSDNIEAEISMLGLVQNRFPALALKRMLAIYDRNPNNAGLNAQIGMAFAEIGNVQDALRYLGTAVSLEPNNASYYYNLAIISDRAGKVDQAIKFYEEALSKDTIYGASRSIPREAVYERLSIIRQRS